MKKIKFLWLFFLFLANASTSFGAFSMSRFGLCSYTSQSRQTLNLMKKAETRQSCLREQTTLTTRALEFANKAAGKSSGRVAIATSEVGGGKNLSSFLAKSKLFTFINDTLNSRISGEFLWTKYQTPFLSFPQHVNIPIDEIDPDISLLKVMLQNQHLAEKSAALDFLESGLFVYANSILTSRSENRAHGWFGLEYIDPSNQKSYLYIHVALKGASSSLQKRIVEKIGMNMIAAFTNAEQHVDTFLADLMKDTGESQLINHENVKIDQIFFGGQHLSDLQEEITSKKMIEHGLADYLLVDKHSGQVVSPITLSDKKREELLNDVNGLIFLSSSADYLDLNDDFYLQLPRENYSSDELKGIIDRLSGALERKYFESKRSQADFGSIKEAASKKGRDHHVAILLNLDSRVKISLLEINDEGSSNIADIHFDNAFGCSYIHRSTSHLVDLISLEFDISVDEFHNDPELALRKVTEQQYLNTVLPAKDESILKRAALTTLQLGDKVYLCLVTQLEPLGKAVTFFLEINYVHDLAAEVKQEMMRTVALNLKHSIFIKQNGKGYLDKESLLEGIPEGSLAVDHRYFSVHCSFVCSSFNSL